MVCDYSVNKEGRIIVDNIAYLNSDANKNLLDRAFVLIFQQA